MLEKLEQRTIKAVILAQEEARRMNSPAVAPGHMFLGLLRCGSDRIDTAAPELFSDLDSLRAAVKRKLSNRVRFPTLEIPFDEEITLCLEHIICAHSSLCAEDLLLTLLRESESVKALLSDCGHSAVQLQDQLSIVEF